jgi:hypothetical protein
MVAAWPRRAVERRMRVVENLILILSGRFTGWREIGSKVEFGVWDLDLD